MGWLVKEFAIIKGYGDHSEWESHSHSSLLHFFNCPVEFDLMGLEERFHCLGNVSASEFLESFLVNF